MNMASQSLSFIKVGGIGGLIFAAIWIICGFGWLFIVGIPPEAFSNAEWIEINRGSAFQTMYLLYPFAWLAVIPFALAARDYLEPSAPIAARIGPAFQLLNAGLYFVNYSLGTANITVANTDPVDAAQFALLGTVSFELTKWLLGAATISFAAYAIALLKLEGLHRWAGWVFALSSVSWLIYAIMRSSGPFFPAEIIHEIAIFSMLGSVGLLGLIMFRTAEAKVSGGGD